MQICRGDKVDLFQCIMSKVDEQSAVCVEISEWTDRRFDFLSRNKIRPGV